MDKKEISLKILSLVIEKGASLTGQFLNFDFGAHINGIHVNLFDSETHEVITYKVHYFGETYGNSIEEILTWLQTL